MRRAIIFANGILSQLPPILRALQPDDLIIAADGGMYHCQSLAITPGVIIGDFDSLDKPEVLALKQAGVEIIQFPRHKDETDLELALQLALEREIDQVYILAALGARWDMTISNILLLAQPRFSNLSLHISEGMQELLLIKENEIVDLHSRAGMPISLIPLSGDVHGITTTGLEYSLQDESLHFGSPRGVSNMFLDGQCRIAIRDGLLLCIYTPAND